MTNTVIELLDEKVIEFNSRIDNEPKFSKMIEGKNRTICICVSDEENYSSKLENLRIEDFVKTDNTDADLVVTAKLLNSKSEVRRTIKNKGIKLNNIAVDDEKLNISINNFDDKKMLKLSHGKKNHVILKLI